MVDPAALRPGRFGVHLYVGLPDAGDLTDGHGCAPQVENASPLDGLIDEVVVKTVEFFGG